ncbi:hypothetical protein NIES2119_09915 [[Phormidium ambiguum] IAM M-71]|uniref:MarR family transcriptional regulator n=1 Tax=[Phormidium ambiguum] IAM M-71 TaxID=454136 RepID=A0A1U7IM25_9CYAN|nr:hypothetical protein [Phormidium ambiguum]OKH38343.1 hypothetical protein NIES2119_09915 [Phormidium ambiguum IAM M-71]
MDEPIVLDPVLLSARDMGLLYPLSEKIGCLRPEVNSANFILWVLWQWGDDWMSTEQVAHLAKKHPNICYSFLERLYDLGLLHRHQSEDWNLMEWKLKVESILVTGKKIPFLDFVQNHQ